MCGFVAAAAAGGRCAALRAPRGSSQRVRKRVRDDVKEGLRGDIPSLVSEQAILPSLQSARASRGVLGTIA